MEEEHTKEPSHNNPEEAANYVKAVDNLLKKFVSDIRGFNPYPCQDAYKNFLHTLSLLLSKLDSAYFTNMDTQLVLDTIPDKECAAFLERPEETADKVQQCVSSDNILMGPEVITKMHLDENITTFDKAGQQAITCLFSHLQDAHNHMSQVAEAVVQLSKVSSPEQFTFVLKLAVRPIIELKILPHLSAPTELKFEKERLTQEETEEYCCNLILPQPFHPKFSSVSFKHPTRCLAAAAHFLIRKELFNSKYPQLQVAKDFAVTEKKLHLAASGRKYDPGKKAHRKRHTPSDNTTAPKASTLEEQQPTQSETITEQQPTQSKTVTDTQQEHVPSQVSSDDDEELPNPFPSSSKTFETKDPKSIPKKPKYSFRHK